MTDSRRNLGAWAKELASISREDFVLREKSPFLVKELSAGDTPDESPALQFSTVAAGSGDVDLDKLLGTRSLGELEVFRLAKRRSGLFEAMVTVGRAENCDVVLPHPSVSKFHAFFTTDPVSGSYQLVDGGSMNGTRIGDERLEAHVNRDVKPRDLVAFGSELSYRFHDAESFHDLAALVV